MKFPSLAWPTRAVLPYAMRGLQIIISISIAAIYVRLLSHSSSSTPVGLLGVLLSFTITSILQSLLASLLSYLSLEKLWAALLDLVCICIFVLTAVMTRGVSADYECSAWLGPSGDAGSDTVMARLLRARGTKGVEGEECANVRAVFGLAVAQCVLMLVTFQMILLALRAKRAEELEAMPEKTWRADDSYSRPVNI